MAEQRIIFNPKLPENQTQELLDFGKKLIKQTDKLSQSSRDELLQRMSHENFSKNAGGKFHMNSDLLFCKSLLIDLLLQDWRISIKRGLINLIMTPVESHIESQNEIKSKTRRRHLLARNAQLTETSVIQFIQKYGETNPDFKRMALNILPYARWRRIKEINTEV